MGLMDRDYMGKQSPGNALSHRRRRSSIASMLGVGILVLALLGFAVWLIRGIDPTGESREATLRVNVNSATLDEIETLPGIGPVLAGLIVSGRPYDSVDDLVRLKGIGPATMEGLRPYVKTSGETEEIR